jgi:glycosyltransferase involved in cell wall biosynthesis
MVQPLPQVIAVDANPAARAVRTGTERYAAELCRRLPAAAPECQFIFYASRPGDVQGLDFTVLPFRRLWSQVRLPVELWQRRPDLLLIPAHVVPFLSPGRAVSVVHDLAFEHFPSAYQPAELAYLRLTTRWAERRCHRLLVVSEATRRDLATRHGIPPERVVVAYPGGGELPRRGGGGGIQPLQSSERIRALGIDRPFVLHVGRIEPRKNQLAALAAVERLRDLLLVCAGPPRDPAMVAQLGRSARCRVLGHVNDATLEALFLRAEALCFPSLYEGFGFPILEAMRYGLPVATVAVSSLPEVGGEAVEYAQNPHDPAEIASALTQAMARREELATRGRAQAARFTWETTASVVAATLREELAR